RKCERFPILVVSLPVEIPILDPDQRLYGAIRQVSVNLHFLAKVMGMRRNPSQFNVARHHHGSLHHVVWIPGWDIDTRIEHDRRSPSLAWGAGKTQAQQRLIMLRFSRGVVMDLDHQIGALRDRTRVLLILSGGNSPRSPSTHERGNRDSGSAETRIRSV